MQDEASLKDLNFDLERWSQIVSSYTYPVNSKENSKQNSFGLKTMIWVVSRNNWSFYVSDFALKKKPGIFGITLSTRIVSFMLCISLH